MYGRLTYNVVDGKWGTVRPKVVRFCGMYDNVMRTLQESGAEDEDYYNSLIGHFLTMKLKPKFRLNFVSVVRFSPKWMQNEVPKFLAEPGEGSGKRYKIYRDKAKGYMKKKWPRSSGSSSMNDDALARLMAECHDRELAIHESIQRQEDMRFYMQSYDHLTGDALMAMKALMAEIKAKYNLLY
ncbi:hypothetical protein Tco_1348457 [Tanacetum coccineum]